MKHTATTTTLIICTCSFILGATLLLSPVHGATLIKRAVADGSHKNGDTTETMKICHVSTPCGWAVYTPFTRRVDYFLRNTCKCAENKKCIRTDDDLSVSAYVYRCRDAANSSTQAPDHDRS